MPHQQQNTMPAYSLNSLPPPAFRYIKYPGPSILRRFPVVSFAQSPSASASKTQVREPWRIAVRPNLSYDAPRQNELRPPFTQIFEINRGQTITDISLN